MRRIGRADPWDSSEALLSIELAKGDSLLQRYCFTMLLLLVNNDKRS